MSIHLEVKYSVEGETHGGYCSDPYDYEQNEEYEYTECIKPKSTWVEQYIGENDAVNENNPSWKYPLIKTEGCPIGSGYCGCKSIHTPISAKLVRIGLKGEFIESDKKNEPVKLTPPENSIQINAVPSSEKKKNMRKKKNTSSAPKSRADQNLNWRHP
tara:strand:+ start:201 stop:674 length:474 start_codon:yes stop_codon:yes gene_type:complete